MDQRGAAIGTTKWLTRPRPKTDHIACPWLIRRFIDPDADIFYIPAGEIGLGAREGARSFGAPGAEFDHRDGRCTFAVLIDAFGLADDRPLARLAPIVHPAHIDGEEQSDELQADTVRHVAQFRFAFADAEPE